MEFIIDKEYKRAEIHQAYGGSGQSGISSTKNHPYIFIFSGKSGSAYGYNDHWDDDGQFIYCGEGQHGDMEFVRGNKAIRDHADNGKEIHLFETTGKGKPVIYKGELICTGWHEAETHDADGITRKGIFFHLMPVGQLQTYSHVPQEEEGEVSGTQPEKSLEELRELALAAGAKPTQSKSNEGRRTVYERSAAVKAYVLARANGVCEGCGADAPFTNKKGQPYLEPHHTRRLSDGGPDDPRWVAALCPNCHREVHYGEHGADYNQRIMEKLRGMEGA